MKKVSQRGRRLQGIYRIVHRESGRLYIGRTVDYASRQRAHVWHLEHGKHQNSKLQRAWDKHGPEAFVFEFLEEVQRDEDLIPREQVYLDKLRPFYNVALDAANPVRFSSHREAFREALRNGERPCCPQGHPYEGDNIIWHGPDKTKKRCRECNRSRAMHTYHRSVAAQGRAVGPSTGERTHCPQGHPYSEENTVLAPNGWRSCHQCRREGKKAAYRQKRVSEGHEIPIANKDRTHCQRGHAFTPENTWTDKHGWRRCLACVDISAARRARPKAEAHG